MTRLLRHPALPGTIIATIALAVALGVPSYAAKTISRALFAKRAGNARKVDGLSASRKPRKNKLLALNKKRKFPSSVFPDDLRGEQGPQGPPGAATGAAGGDLSGSYPNPSIADGAVTPSKIGTVPAARVWDSLNQSASSAAPLTLTFDSEIYDTQNLHSNVSNTSRLTAPIAGIYAITGTLSWSLNAVGNRSTEILQTGSLTNETLALETVPTAGAVDATSLTVATQARLVAGDFVELVGVQDSGGPLEVMSLPPSATPTLQMTWIAP